jgi:poly(A) polymerase Pap1
LTLGCDLLWKRPGRSVVILPFGSYRLDAHDPASDLDLLIISCQWVTVEDFFTSFLDKLRRSDRVSAICPVPEAYTPVIKFEVSGKSVCGQVCLPRIRSRADIRAGIPVDLLFVSLRLDELPVDPPLDVLCIDYLRGLSEPGRSSARVTGPARSAKAWRCSRGAQPEWHQSG